MSWDAYWNACHTPRCISDVPAIPSQLDLVDGEWYFARAYQVASDDDVFLDHDDVALDFSDDELREPRPLTMNNQTGWME